MRKFTAVALVLLMVISLCACGKKDTGEKEREYTLILSLPEQTLYFRAD